MCGLGHIPIWHLNLTRFYLFQPPALSHSCVRLQTHTHASCLNHTQNLLQLHTLSFDLRHTHTHVQKLSLSLSLSMLTQFSHTRVLGLVSCLKLTHTEPAPITHTLDLLRSYTLRSCLNLSQSGPNLILWTCSSPIFKPHTHTPVLFKPHTHSGPV